MVRKCVRVFRAFGTRQLQKDLSKWLWWFSQIEGGSFNIDHVTQSTSEDRILLTVFYSIDDADWRNLKELYEKKKAEK